MVGTPAFNSNTPESEADGSLRVQGQPGLESQFQTGSKQVNKKDCGEKNLAYFC